METHIIVIISSICSLLAGGGWWVGRRQSKMLEKFSVKTAQLDVHDKLIDDLEKRVVKLLERCQTLESENEKMKKRINELENKHL